jgi:hypothetical protein
MKSLATFVNEGMSTSLFETFSAPTAQKIFDAMKMKWEQKSLGVTLQWDKIPEECFHEITPEEGKKLAYQRNSIADIFWFSNGELTFRTYGNFSWHMYGVNPRAGRIKSVKKISEISDSAIWIENAEKYSTNALRKERAEQKQGALALKAAEDVKNENIERYQKAVALIKLEKSADEATMVAKLNIATEEYTQAVSDLVSHEAETLHMRVSAIEEINEIYSNIVWQIEDLTRRKETSERSRKRGLEGYNTTSKYMNNIIEQAKLIDKQIENMRAKIAYWRGKLA